METLIALPQRHRVYCGITLQSAISFLQFSFSTFSGQMGRLNLRGFCLAVFFCFCCSFVSQCITLTDTVYRVA